MTFALSLFALAAAQTTTTCGLSSDYDPTNICELTTAEWGNIDADSVPSDAVKKMSLTIHEKEAHTDIFEFNHTGTTPGSLSAKVNGRYILSCPQPEGTDEMDNKAVKFTVHRPASMTEFGAEWVKLYPKDMWKNVTNEYEPWTMNKYGAKIPLLRHTPDGDPPVPDTEDSVTVYMEVSDIGDYEVKYGNGQIVTYPADGSEARWVAVEFKSTLLRVGSPWAACDATEALEADAVSVGTIIPALFGHPNLNLEAYEAFTAEVKAATTDYAHDISVVLEIFGSETMTKTKGLYTMSEAKADLPAGKSKTEHASKKDYTSCYEAGNACPENHQVCKASFCELDTFETIITNLKAAGVKVLGAVGDGATEADYDLLDTKVDGFFHTIIGSDGLVASLSGEVADPTDDVFKVAATGEPLFDSKKVDEADTWLTLSFDDIGVWNPYSWYPHKANKKWAAIVDSVTEANMPTTVKTLVDRGYGYIYITDKDAFATTSSYNELLFAELKTAMGGRRLQQDEGRRLTEEVTYSWGCDDTMFKCTPVCLKQNGPVTTMVSGSMCADEPMDQCKCKCYYDAKWECQDDNVVCMATKGVEASVVGDLVCETRGTDKPSCGETPMPTTRGDFPTGQCLATWGTTVAPEETTTEEPTTEEPTTEAPDVPIDAVDAEEEEGTEAPTESEDDDEESIEDSPVIVMESFSMAAALALVALH